MDTGRIVLYIAATVDGFIAAEDGGVDWLEDFQSDTSADDGGYAEFFAGIDALVMGARTYEQVRSFGEWPYEDRPTYVLTHGEASSDVDTVVFVDEEIASLGPQLKGQYERIWLVGGAAVVRAFLDAGQLDELRVSVVPLLLGRGIRLFGADGVRESLELVGSTEHDGGIVELQYTVG